MSKEEMKSKIRNLVTEQGSASFVQLEQLLGEEAKGSMSVTLGKGTNVVYWAGVSELFVQALEELVGEDMELKHVPKLVYLADGKIMDLPPATKRGVKNGYKDPHWLPVVLIYS